MDFYYKTVPLDLSDENFEKKIIKIWFHIKQILSIYIDTELGEVIKHALKFQDCELFWLDEDSKHCSFCNK